MKARGKVEGRQEGWESGLGLGAALQELMPRSQSSYEEPIRSSGSLLPTTTTLPCPTLISPRI